jgi:hypothetical protein
VFLVRAAHLGTIRPRPLKARDAFGELGAIARAVHRRIQNTGTQELCNELKFVGGQTRQEPPYFRFQRLIGALNKGGYQRLSQRQTSCRWRNILSYVHLAVLLRIRQPRARGWEEDLILVTEAP